MLAQEDTAGLEKYGQIYKYHNGYLIKKDGKYGFANFQKEVIISVVYDNLEELLMSNGSSLFIGKKNDYYGVLDIKGNTKLPFEYSKIHFQQKNQVFLLTKNDVFIVYDTNLKSIFNYPDIDYVGLDISGLIIIGRTWYTNPQKPSYHEKIRKFAVFDNMGKQLLPFEYDHIDGHNNILIIEKENTYGCLNNSLTTLLPIEYDELYQYRGYLIAKKKDSYIIFDVKQKKFISKNQYSYLDYSNKYLCAKKGNSAGLISFENDTIIPFQYAYVSYLNDSLFCVRQNEKFGLVNRNNKVILPIDYDKFDFDYQSNIVGFTKNGKKGKFGEKYHEIYEHKSLNSAKYTLFNAKNQVITDDSTIVDEAYSNLEKTEFGVRFQYEGNYGYFDFLGKIIVAPKYSNLSYFYKNLAAACNYDECGYINTKGDTIIPFHYTTASHYPNSDLLVVSKEGKYGAINFKNEVVVPFKFDFLEFFSDGMAKFIDGKTNLAGFINTSGKETIPAQFKYAEMFRTGICQVKNQENEDILIDKNGKVVEAKREYNIGEGFIWIVDSLNNHWIVDSSNNRKTTFPEDCILLDNNVFSEGLLALEKKREVGFINKEIQFVIPPSYSQGLSFSEGLAAVQKNSKWGFINNKNEIIIPFDFEQAFSFENGLAAVKINDKIGFINNKGTVIIPIIYEEVSSFKQGLAMVSKNKTNYYFINKQGKCIIGCK